MWHYLNAEKHLTRSHPSILHGRSSLPQHPHQLYQFPTVGDLLIFCYLSLEVTDRCRQTVVCVLRPQFLQKEMNQERSGDPQIGTVNHRNEDGTPMFTNTMQEVHGCESNHAAKLLLVTHRIQADWESQPQIPERQPATWNQGLDGLQ